ncbi:MAG TPA: DUF488 domain-containing protein [Armatimonadota bacterium]|nr:DUF488 domain-containing protein [Armatimonadota bacterium]
MIRLKRAYDPPAPEDGRRILVDRLWPRGVKKEAAHVDLWLKEVAPSTALRQWFGHDPDRWEEFRRRYRAELGERSALIQQLKDEMKKGPVTLLYSAHDTEHNNAVVIKELLES